MSESTDLLVIGAGPCGLAVAIAARQAGIPCVVLDRRTIVSTIERYPLQMTFFSTPERIEIGGIPFIASHEKPTRADGLIYYRRVAEHFELDIRPGEDVVADSRWTSRGRTTPCATERPTSCSRRATTTTRTS
jgi:thioredoxin reductase (NADPH)